MARMTMSQFFEHCQTDVIDGYVLDEGQESPETYERLVEFIARRLGIQHEGEFSVASLSFWLINNGSVSDSCSPDLDNEHIAAVLLIGELYNRDAYVAQLPDEDGALALPPLHVVRRLIKDQT